MICKKLSKYLHESYKILIVAYPGGLTEKDYFPLLYVLYDDFSDRNLAELISYTFSIDYYVVLNDIAKAIDSNKPYKMDYIRVRDWLIKNGYDEKDLKI